MSSTSSPTLETCLSGPFTPSFLLAMSVVTATQNGLSLPVAEGS